MTERKELPNNEVQETNEPNLVQKIVKAIKNAKGVTEDGYNAYSKYRYTTDKQVSKVARKLVEQGVIVIPSLSIVDRWKDGKNNFVQVAGNYTLTDGNQTFKAKCDGIGADTLDKGVYKAETGAKKNFFMQLMLLSSDEDTDDDHGKGMNEQSSQNNQGYQQNNNYQSNNQQGGSNFRIRKANEKQLNFIKSLFKQYAEHTNRNGEDGELLNTTVLKKYSKNSPSEITSEEASDLINRMQAAVKKAKQDEFNEAQ